MSSAGGSTLHRLIRATKGSTPAASTLPRGSVPQRPTKVSPAMAAPSSASASADQGMQEQQSQKQPLIMQIIVDRHLVSSPEWSLGPLMTQAAHAATAATVSTLETSPLTRAYVSPENLPQMHKVVLQTPEKGAMSDLRALSAKLAEGRAQWEADRKEDEQGGSDNDDHWFPGHYLWIEQPEDVPTCIAVAPNRKPPALKKILNKCSLLKQ